MTNLKDLTTNQLKDIIAIKEKIEALQREIESITVDGGGGIRIPSNEEAATPGKRKLSPAHRRKLIKALAKARAIRSANLKKAKAITKLGKKKDRRSSPATRAKLAAAAKARWAKVRAEGKTAL
jgi:hypothetical protein